MLIADLKRRKYRVYDRRKIFPDEGLRTNKRGRKNKRVNIRVNSKEYQLHKIKTIMSDRV